MFASTHLVFELEIPVGCGSISETSSHLYKCYILMGAHVKELIEVVPPFHHVLNFLWKACIELINVKSTDSLNQ